MRNIFFSISDLKDLIKKNREDLDMLPYLCNDCLYKSLKSKVLDSYCEKCRERILKEYMKREEGNEIKRQLEDLVQICNEVSKIAKMVLYHKKYIPKSIRLEFYKTLYDAI